MLDADSWQEIVATLKKNRLRTALTACGVFWGIFMLVLMLGFGNGLEQGVTRGMRGFATNSMYVWGQRTTLPYKGLSPGRRVQLTNEDTAALRANIPEIQFLAPRAQLGGWRGGDNISRGDKTANLGVSGDLPEYAMIQPMTMVAGRFVNDLDIAGRRKIAVIGPRAYAELFAPGENPIGQHIKIQGVYFMVVGHFQPKQSGHMAERQAQTVFIPLTTFQQAFNYANKVDFFAVAAPSQVSAAALEAKVRYFLAERQRVAPDDRPAFGSFNAGEAFGKMMAAFTGIKVVVWLVGIMTLLAGVIGVSNIMLIVVKERTKEIGIRKALGATPMSIVGQIIQESTLLTAVAGYLGLCAGVGLLELVGAVMGPSDTGVFAPPSVDLRIALIATVVLIVSGMVAGFMPARHAAGIDPVEALRAA
jgi:putative ABC transport system permease protein